MKYRRLIKVLERSPRRTFERQIVAYVKAEAFRAIRIRRFAKGAVGLPILVRADLIEWDMRKTALAMHGLFKTGAIMSHISDGGQMWSN